MIDQLTALDKALFLFLNGLHTPWLDSVMAFISKTVVWTPLYVFLLIIIIKEHRYKSWIILLAIGITIVLTDQITTGFMKPFFGRLRPSHEPSLEGLIHLVNGYKGGAFGFASSHAANTFGVATFVTLLLRAKIKWIGMLFLWSALVSYSRVYLGVHYPSDIVVGGIVGIVCGWLTIHLYRWIDAKTSQKENAIE